MKDRSWFGWIKQSLGVALLACAALLFLSQIFFPALQRQTHGFAAYYTGAWLLHHERATSLYDPVAFNAAMQESGISGIYDIYDANAPLLAALTYPLGFWKPMTARAIWLWLNLGLLALALFPATRLTGRRGLLPFCLAGTFLLFYAPLREDFRLGQMYMPVLTAAFLALTLTNPIGKATALALQLMLKFYYGVFGLAAGLSNFKAALLGVAITALAAIILLPWLGPALWLDYARLSTGFAGRPETAVTAYQTFNGFFSHLFRYDAQWNPQPIANLPDLARFLTLASSFMLISISVFVIWRAFRRAKTSATSELDITNLTQLSTALAFTLAPLVAPVAEEYHYTLLALPILVSSFGFRVPSSEFQVQSSKFRVPSSKFQVQEQVQEAENRDLQPETRNQKLTPRATPRAETQNSKFKTQNFFLWLLAVGLVGWPWGYKEWASDGWRSLVSYPRLYGALALWVLLVRLIGVATLPKSTLTLGQNINDR